MKQEIILETKSVGKFFYEPEKFRVLDDINFDVHRGEFVSLIGKSGSGKSTLLYILSTMDTEYDGHLIIDGKDVTGLKQNELAAISAEITVLNNLLNSLDGSATNIADAVSAAKTTLNIA